MNEERSRLNEARNQTTLWKKWGPYVSERQWGTVREDYSEGGDAWNYFTHDQARSRTYRWERTAWQTFPMTNSNSASRWPFGTARTQSSRNGSSALPTRRVITAKT